VIGVQRPSPKNMMPLKEEEKKEEPKEEVNKENQGINDMIMTRIRSDSNSTKKAPNATGGRKDSFNNDSVKGNILKWKIGKFINAGNFGKVYQGMEVESGRIIAVKMISMQGVVDAEIIQSLEVS
jgi:hypothetical protein